MEDERWYKHTSAFDNKSSSGKRRKTTTEERSREVSRCFKPSQPQRIISGLRESFIKRYILERTNKAEIRPGEQREMQRIVGRIYGMKYSWNGHKDRNRHKNRIKKEWASSVGLCQKHKPQHPHHVKVSPWGQKQRRGQTRRRQLNWSKGISTKNT